MMNDYDKKNHFTAKRLHWHPKNKTSKTVKRKIILSGLPTNLASAFCVLSHYNYSSNIWPLLGPFSEIKRKYLQFIKKKPE